MTGQNTVKGKKNENKDGKWVVFILQQGRKKKKLDKAECLKVCVVMATAHSVQPCG